MLLYGTENSWFIMKRYSTYTIILCKAFAIVNKNMEYLLSGNLHAMKKTLYVKYGC